MFVGLSTDGGLRFAKVTDIVPTGRPASSARKAGPPSGRAHCYLGRPADQPFIAVGAGSVWVSYANAASEVVQAAGARVSGRGRVGSFGAPQSIPTRHGRATPAASPSARAARSW